jgi:hypothetical protein
LRVIHVADGQAAGDGEQQHNAGAEWCLSGLHAGLPKVVSK